MKSSGVALFDTAVGVCGIAWKDDVVVGLTLPDASPEQALERLSRLRPGLGEATPPWPDLIARAIEEIRALLSGERPDLKDVPLDLDALADFDRRVYAITRDILPGQTLTYGDVAHRLGDVGLSRAVGQSLGRNPFPIVIPCHRVVAAGGAIGGFSAPGGASTKRQILAIESAQSTLPW